MQHHSLPCTGRREGLVNRRRLVQCRAHQALTAPVAVITGAGSPGGIGQATALLLAQEGWRVYAGVERPEEVDQMRMQHPSLQPVLLDVTNAEDIRRAVLAIDQAVGPQGVQALINNAGKGAIAPIEFLPDAMLRDQLEVNLIGALKVTQAFLPLMRRGQRKGRIVFISSLAGTIGLPMFATYAITKFGMEALADMLRLELQDQGIKVVVIKPGPVKTPIWSRSYASTMDNWESLQSQPLAESLYGKQFRQLLALARISEETGEDVTAVTSAILEALTTPNPRARYQLPLASNLVMKLRKLLPDEVWDAVLMRVLSSLR